MPLRDFASVRYIPLLDVRPAELVALEELPNKDKDELLPLFRLRPWVGAKNLNKAIHRILAAYGTRPCFLELGGREVVAQDKYRDVHRQLEALRNPSGGYEQWVEFLQMEGHEHFIPVLQLGDPAQVSAQIRSLAALNRGLLVHIYPSQIDAVALARFIGEHTSGGVGVVLLLDYFKQTSAFLVQADEVRLLINLVLAASPNAVVAISASSFPGAFTSITEQEIFERTVFNRVAPSCTGPVLYSDRGGARAERQAGGGGLPAPRIDFAKPNSWVFFRQEDPVPSLAMGYQRQAKRLIDSPHWDPNLKLWGCQMVEKTALGDDMGIVSPNRSTAARINIHLHQQLWYGDTERLYDTDEEWVD